MGDVCDSHQPCAVSYEQLICSACPIVGASVELGKALGKEEG